MARIQMRKPIPPLPSEMFPMDRAYRRWRDLMVEIYSQPARRAETVSWALLPTGRAKSCQNSSQGPAIHSGGQGAASR
jgi:hypothetical protein